MSVDQRFSSIRNKCIHCGGDHAPGACPMRMQPQATPSTEGYQVYNNSTGAGKINNNASLSLSSKNGQSAAASTTPSSLANNLTAQGCASCTQEPQITPQVSPSTSQQSSYNIPPMHPPNQFPTPYFPIPYPPPPIAPLMCLMQFSSCIRYFSSDHPYDECCDARQLNTTAITNALERMTTQFADALQQTIQIGVDVQAQENKNARMDKQFEKVKVFDGSKPPSVTHGWRRYTPCVFKQEGLSTKCCYYVQVRLSVISSQTCPLKQWMIKSRMIL